MGRAIVSSREPIQIGTVLSGAFGLISRRPAAVLGVGLIATLPAQLLNLLLENLGLLPPLTGTNWVSLAPVLIAAGLFGCILQTFAEGALVGAALAERVRKPIRFFETLIPALQCLPVIIPVALLFALGVSVGFVLLVIPSVILLLAWSVTGPVIVAERTGITEAFRRSQALTDNTRGRIFLLNVAAGLMTAIFHWTVGRLDLLAFDTGSIDANYATQTGSFLVQTLSALVITAFNTALSCALYIALLERSGGSPMTGHLEEIFA